MIPKNATTAVALVGGYVLGRTRKAKVAIGVGMFLAGRRLDLDPRRIGKLLAASPVTGALSDQVRRELVEATKSAATRALTQRATGLADTLQRRTQALGRTDEAEADADADVDEAGDSEDGGKRKARARPASATKTATKTASKTAAKTAKKKPASEGSTSTSRGRPSGGGTDRTRRTSTTARKRASAPRKSSASATRKARSDDDA
ncbi:hypothetical protein [Streptomyces sp. NPDC048350]|uniref:hypothetical protein n=1 Tax=Streptomyces sp. NPDC048350 TaxID=3365538 RepID=UPI0037135476